MIKKFFIAFLLLSIGVVFAQKSSEQTPIFSSCDKLQGKELETCFYQQVQTFIYTNFQVPQKLKDSNYKGSINVLFEVDNKGTFKVLYVDANQVELKNESQRVFDKIPKVLPATFNGAPTYAKYTIKISVPLQNPSQIASEKEIKEDAAAVIKTNRNKELTELDSIRYQKFSNPQFESHLNIPFSHSYYAQFDSALNQLGSNNHTGSKPYTYAEVSKYYNLAAENEKLMKNKTSWWGKKIWNENTVAIQGKDYWFTMNPIFDIQMGKSTPSTSKYTYVNTRAIQIRGGLGSQLNFTTTIYESQGRFADYYNNYADAIAQTNSIAEQYITYVLGDTPNIYSGSIGSYTTWRVAYIGGNPVPTGVYSNGFDLDTLAIISSPTDLTTSLICCC